MTATSGAGITNGASAEEYVERIDVGASVNGPPARGGRWAVTGGIERRRRSKGYQALPSTDPAATETARDHMASAVRYHVFLSRVQQAGKPLSPPLPRPRSGPTRCRVSEIRVTTNIYDTSDPKTRASVWPCARQKQAAHGLGRQILSSTSLGTCATSEECGRSTEDRQ